MIKNITPFFLDGGVQEVTSGNSEVSWNGTSSFVTIAASGARSFILPDNVNGKKIPFGTMVVIVKSDNNSNVITVNPTSDVSNTVASVALSAQYQTCMFMFKGPRGSNVIGEWALLSFGVGGGSGSFNGGTVAEATTFSSSIEVDGTSQFDGSVTFNGIAQINNGIHMTRVDVVPAGTLQSTATVMSQGDLSKTIITSNPPVSNNGIMLPNNNIANKVFYVFNTNATNNLKVYPTTGGSINNSLNTSITVAARSSKMLFCLDADNNWIAS